MTHSTMSGHSRKSARSLSSPDDFTDDEPVTPVLAPASTPKKRRKPAKSTAGKFPLFKHASGRWCKKVKGRFLYFGKVADDPSGELALNKWLDEKEAHLAGRTPREKTDGLSIARLCNHFMTAKKHLLETGELSERTYQGYYAACDRLVNELGKYRTVVDLVADDFRRLRASYAKTRGPVSLGNEIQRIRMVFKYGFDAGLIETPVRFGQDFKKPSRKTLRIHRNEKKLAHGSRMFDAAELRTILDATDQPLRAMILLAANCGFGQSDLSSLPLAAIDLDAGWVDYPRPKTGVQRRCPLWPETIEAVRDALKRRPLPKDDDDAGLVFITKYGHRFVKTNATGTPDDAIGKEFAKLLNRLKIKRKGVSFYAIRHGFETVAGESRDQVAVDYIMGHARDDMASLYRESISDDRLRDVTNLVRNWLFATNGGAK
ncbi:MAG: tyrosine-type recombinase/integrase [Planctomycetota bacterium]|nr:tyrosine-type recombinase/integrase [Planctomycetota bacterium]